MTPRKGKVIGARTRKDEFSFEYNQPLRRYKGKFTVEEKPHAGIRLVLSNATVCSDIKRISIHGTVEGKAVHLVVQK